jgi:translation initiation factor 4B
MSDAGSERGGSRRQNYFEGDGKVRDFSNWERKGPLSPVPGNGPPVRDGGRVREGGPPMERRRSPAWGEGRSDAGSRPPRREFEARPPPVERQPTAAEQDNQWRARMRPDPSPVATPDASSPSSPQAQALKERPKLNLQKRTVSTADGEPAANSASDSKASPFGAARPVDTATKEREMEEKRQLAIRQKKEAEEKAKEDKAAREAADRAARAERADRGQAQEDNSVSSPVSESGGKGRRASRQQNGTKPTPKENGETPTSAKPGFTLLRRDAEGDDGEEGADEDNENANGAIIHDKAVKPQEPVVEKAAAGQAADPTAQQLEDEGWSTVPSSKPKNNRRGGGARPIAS